jgi:hypothetical protein
MFFSAKNTRYAISKTNWTGEQAATSDKAMEQGKWKHLAVSYNSATKTVKIYMNGAAVATATYMTLAPKALGTPAFNFIGKSSYALNGDLYWGSGLNWVNGHCFVVKLNKDMVTFNGEIKDVTPPNYFEAPFMLKRGLKYYLMYSEGNVTNETYKVRYSVGDSPYGLWTEGKNSPILSTTSDSATIAPGHHTVFIEHGQYYILYHRHSKRIPKGSKDLLRELCVDSLKFTSDGFIEKINPKDFRFSVNQTYCLKIICTKIRTLVDDLVNVLVLKR